ncbi:hypothetical protein HF313_26080 [Massilia atriviolacea]|uniref:Uncharacterized protein n=1 Tax=Massilia atriviolacea TaxID=2495579 RepID=A0A430HMS3_9BURK|nr:hypothetical protein [Massilia atriviolacea]RSZ58866.1 hypothetical protein EJB06_11015 [Massilia atriviolacea]
MAAEAFIIDENGLKKFGGDALIDALKVGNNHNSKFTKAQATEFAKYWEVVAHKENSKTGFQELFLSAALMIHPPVQKLMN